MAVERMRLINVVLPREKLLCFMRDLLLHERIELVDARKMIDETTFLLRTQRAYTQQIYELNMVEHIAVHQRSREALEALKEMAAACALPLHFKPQACAQCEDFFEALPQELWEDPSFLAAKDDLEKAREDVEALLPYQEMADLGVDFALGKLMTLDFFETQIGYVSLEDGQRLRRLAEELSLLFFAFGRKREAELMLFVYPKELATEAERILQSLAFKPLELDPRYLDLHLGEALESKTVEKAAALAEAEARMQALAEARAQDFQSRYSQLLLETKLLDCLEDVGGTPHFAYLSMWTPEAAAERIEKSVNEDYGGQTSVLRSAEAKVYEQAPTSLKNHAFVRPFEQMVTMYGTPSYKEMDPTSFFAMTYMLLFGIMFGDLGQGFVFWLAGRVLRRRSPNGPGPVLERLGLASMVTGFFFDSFFGYEGLLSSWLPWPIFFHPFAHANSLLAASVVLGVLLLSLSYLFGILNKCRQQDYEEAFLGKEGLAGLLLQTSFLLMVLQGLKRVALPAWLGGTGLLVSAALIFLREPLYRLLVGKRPLYRSGASDYYVENSFGLLEALLSVLSNLLSFIRVGAFALNHVGLFLAFHTVAHLINSRPGDIAMGILGNLVILGLEGLIVFIQGLRLMYYELFSKFFKGEGRAFAPVSLTEVSK